MTEQEDFDATTIDLILDFAESEASKGMVPSEEQLVHHVLDLLGLGDSADAYAIAVGLVVQAELKHEDRLKGLGYDSHVYGANAVEDGTYQKSLAVALSTQADQHPGV